MLRLLLSTLLLAASLRADELMMRPPSIPLITKEPFVQTWMPGNNATATDVTYWTGATQQIVAYVRVDNITTRVLGGCQGDYGFACPAEATPVSVNTNATKTVFVSMAGPVQVTLGFISSGFADDYLFLSRPVDFVSIAVRSTDGNDHNVQVYFDWSAEHVVNHNKQSVGWSSFDEQGLTGLKMGVADQRTLDLSGDNVNRDWGYQYITSIPAPAIKASMRAGSLRDQRRSFVSTGQLPSDADTNQPRAVEDDMPSMAVVASYGLTGDQEQELVVMVAYDDIESVSYYGDAFKAYWTQTYSDIFSALSAAAADYHTVVTTGQQVEDALWQAASAKAGPKYAFLTSLAYRQTLAAVKLVWNHNINDTWVMLKEISTNGDMQTMDVIYPASPMFLYTNASLLKRMLVPVLSYANNETKTPFTNPFSPHQIGKYPIADATTASQEPMPMENTGNMFLMLAAITKQSSDTSFFYPRYWPLLRSWANYLNQSLPFPANQLCTDDFTGHLANNTNLAAKAIVALEAFVSMCDLVGEDCSDLKAYPKYFANIWETVGYEAEPIPHYKIAFNISNSYSIKYNLVWQKLLGMDGPFNWDKVAAQETAYYLKVANKYGTPLDYRHSYVKLDWLSWAATMAPDHNDSLTILDAIYELTVNTPTRVPLTDLYDTITGEASKATGSSYPHFVARPVVGGVFAQMLTRS
eukprot:TRINITY_DN7774_c0_g1_i1.p1 TRINITY_DN7774_c0_g1~~TRINITY_DN7774_c0_g1_i1.p1  ORF type:complete len:695 (+),score=181.27 TRINITY_DN7774_c0_g1_i1:31-2115(+)